MMENRCVCCGEIIPEGRQVCEKCELNAILDKDPPSRMEVIDEIQKLQEQMEDRRWNYYEGEPEYHYYDGMVYACVIILDMLRGGTG